MKYTASFLSIGNEVLKGSVLNTNSQFIGRELSALGFEVARASVCADSRESIKHQLDILLRRSDLVVVSGGLGPTPDDVTRQSIADFFRVPLKFSATQFSHLKKVYKKFGKRVPPLVRLEAFYPENAKPLVNRFGIALGFSVEIKNKILIVLPGVPYELQNMYFAIVRPYLKKKFKNLSAIKNIVVKTTGISEPDVMSRLGEGFVNGTFDFGIYPSAGEVALRIQTNSAEIKSRIARKIKSALKDWIYSWKEQTLAFTIGEILSRNKKTLAVAESCTGGLLASKITATTGASIYFKGGVVTYNASAKEWLGVGKQIIKENGEVSPEVAKSLAENIRKKMETDFGLAITGIAGPTGGSAKKPVGLVYIALAKKGKKTQVLKNNFWGERQQIQEKSAIKALELLWRETRD